MLVDLSEREGVLDVDVSGMIAGVMELSDIPLREVMVPRVQMVAFDVEDPPEELLQLFCSEKCTFIPLYENKVDNVLGVVHVKDLFLKAEEKDLRSLIRPVPFIPETASAEDALKRFRAEHAKMALAVDEYGAVQGLVTIEDVLEEVVGEITDEYDEAESPPVESLGPRKYRLRGELNIREWEELFSMQLPRMPVDTIGGLVTALLDRVPHEGDSAEYGNLKFTVETIRGRRVETVILELDRSDEDEEGENAGTG
jgi:CBS domain containing-hemolysin-like protein